MSGLFSKPFALSIGPQGCGTDILHTYFKGRGDIALPDVQEIFYFDRHVQRGEDFYKSHFKNVMDAALVMELTTTAFDHPQAPARVLELLGRDVKLFCPLRHPVQRAEAVYRQYLRYGIVKGDIEEACEQAPQILNASRYSVHLQAWLEVFDHIHFISFESLEVEREKILQTLCDFLALPCRAARKKAKLEAFLPKIWLPHRKKTTDDGLASWLTAQLEGEAEQAEKLTGCNFSI